MKAHIYQPTKSTMQSGRVKKWILEYTGRESLSPENLMGWTSSEDTLNQVKIPFDDLEAAIRFAENKGFDYKVDEAKERRVMPKSYADNFK